jgi:hypothetical protein
MQTDVPSLPWYRKRRYQIIIVVLAVLLVLSLVTSIIPLPPKSSDQSRLDRTIAYFASNYDAKTGLISETPGSNTYWLFPDNYLAQLAILRDDPSNSSTLQFAQALYVALEGYAATLPSSLSVNQFTALNSTSASFGCQANYTLSWSVGGSVHPGNGSAILKTGSNDQSQGCASQNYSDIILLQAVYYHRLGNSSTALNFYHLGSADFNGKGFADVAFDGTTYRTYKLALYVYASGCLGQSSVDANFPAAEHALFMMQDNSTGGFYSGYDSSFSHAGTTVNTETTALAALAIDQLIHPAADC